MMLRQADLFWPSGSLEDRQAVREWVAAAISSLFYTQEKVSTNERQTRMG